MDADCEAALKPDPTDNQKVGDRWRVLSALNASDKEKREFSAQYAPRVLASDTRNRT
jgi:hypothetical protein